LKGGGAKWDYWDAKNARRRKHICDRGGGGKAEKKRIVAIDKEKPRFRKYRKESTGEKKSAVVY